MSARRRSPRSAPDWANLNDAELERLPFRKLGLRVEDAPNLQRAVRQVERELQQCGLHWRPHVWLSSSFFSPDGVPGVALPFYLAHPRLVRLERRHSLGVEGLGHAELVRLVRHEVGHALDTAFGLSRRADWRRLFGLRSAPYPRRYRARPDDSRFVVHLRGWYAQSHPAEDFAETFAVWLARPSSRTRYAGTPAGEKLAGVATMLGELAGSRPLVKSRERTESLGQLSQTLGEHYALARASERRQPAPPFDAALRAWFPAGSGRTVRSGAAAQLTSLRAGTVERARRRGHHPYSSREVLDALAHRCRILGLRRARRAPSLRALDEALDHALSALRRGRWLLSR